MRRLALVFLALAIVGIGAGIFVWLGQTPVAAAKTQPAATTGDLNLTQNNNASPQNSTDLAPAASTSYDSNAEEQMNTSAPKAQGHQCNRDQSASTAY